MGPARANFFALGAITLWVSLAALGVTLQHVPPFLLTGIALLIGSLVALPLSRFNWRVWRLPWPTLAAVLARVRIVLQNNKPLPT